MDRRTFNSALTGLASSSLMGCTTLGSLIATASKPQKTILYQSVGARLTPYDVDVETGTLSAKAPLFMPSNVQYVWPHPLKPYLYVSTSDAVAGIAGTPGKVHRLCAVKVDAEGNLSMHGPVKDLPSRPIHNSVDATGRFVFTAFNNPSAIRVHAIDLDGRLQEPIEQMPLDPGVYAHQVRSTPSNRAVILITRGNKAEKDKAEDPGALKIFNFKSGLLSPLTNLQVGGKGGHGYGPRHLDFHPTKPWVYVSVESQNQLHMHTFDGESLSKEPLFIKSSVSKPYEESFPQIVGPIHIHPKGQTVYLANRASATTIEQGKSVFRGGENNIAVFSIHPTTGEPKLIQHIDTQSFHVRTFSIDPSGRLLIAASISDMWVKDKDQIRHTPAALSVFRISAEGRLSFLRKYDVPLEGGLQWWIGLLNMPLGGL